MRRRHASLKDVLRQVLPAGVKKRVYSVELLRKRWSQIVGNELARRSEPEALSEGVLTVRVTDAVWGKMIYRLQDRIIPVLNRTIGTSLVRRINFTKRSRLRDAAQIADGREAPLQNPPPPRRLIEAAAAIEDSELRELVLRSATHYLSAQDERRKAVK